MMGPCDYNTADSWVKFAFISRSTASNSYCTIDRRWCRLHLLEEPVNKSTLHATLHTIVLARLVGHPAVHRAVIPVPEDDFLRHWVRHVIRMHLPTFLKAFACSLFSFRPCSDGGAGSLTNA